MDHCPIFGLLEGRVFFREQRTEDREQGTGNREQGTGSAGLPAGCCVDLLVHAALYTIRKEEPLAKLSKRNCASQEVITAGAKVQHDFVAQWHD
jgi:hypothetical protein